MIMTETIITKSTYIEKRMTNKKMKKNKPSSPTVKETPLKAPHSKETNEEEKDERRDTSYNK